MTDFGQHSEDTWRAFIGPNANNYVRQWGVLQWPRPEFSVNWAAAFLSVGWMAYRCMYRRVIVLFAAFEIGEQSLYFALRAAGASGWTTDQPLWHGLERTIGLMAAVLIVALSTVEYLLHIPYRPVHGDDREGAAS